MKTLRFKRLATLAVAAWILTAAFLLPAFAAGALAGENAAAAEDGRIEITADRLVTDNTAGSAEFSGTVRAVQGDTEITADRLILFYKNGTGQTTAMDSGTIERMEAYGSVRIEFDNKVAVSDQAVYITKERKLVLEGAGSRVTSGRDRIEGNKITFFRNDVRVALEGNAGNRVKAIIHSDQRGLN